MWLDLAAGAAWCDDYELNAEVDGTNMDGLITGTFSSSFPFALKEDVTLTPYIKYVDASDLEADLSMHGAEVMTSSMAV